MNSNEIKKAREIVEECAGTSLERIARRADDTLDVQAGLYRDYEAEAPQCTPRIGRMRTAYADYNGEVTVYAFGEAALCRHWDEEECVCISDIISAYMSEDEDRRETIRNIVMEIIMDIIGYDDSGEEIARELVSSISYIDSVQTDEEEYWNDYFTEAEEDNE